MATDLFINGKRCDLPVDSVIATSYANNFIGEVIAPAGSNSNQFKLPKTQQNRNIFETAESINSDTDVPYQKLPARLLQNGRELIPDGFAIINDSDRSYNVVVYGGNLDFFERIKGLKLRDLDLSEFDHIWNQQNIIASRNNDDGYIYPIIDWSDDQAFIDNDTNRIHTRQMYHAIFVHTVMDKIFEAQGFDKVGDILDSPEYKSLIVPVVDSIQSDALKDDREVKMGLVPTTQQLGIGLDGDSSVFYRAIDLPLIIKDIYGFRNFGTINTTPGPLLGGGTFFYLSGQTGRYSVQFSGQHYQTEPTQYPAIFQLWVVKPSGTRVIVASQGITVSQVYFGPGGTGAGDPGIDTTFSMDEGDKLVPVIVSGGVLPTTQYPTAFIIEPVMTVTPLSAKSIYNTTISAGDNLPNMTQVDFMKSVARIFGVIFQTNSFTKSVEFNQFKGIYKNLLNAKDWTSKHDRNTTNKQPRISYHARGYAQENVFEWSNQVSQTLPEELGEGSILVADETLTDKKTLIKIPFSATEMDKRLVDLDVPVIRFTKLGVPKGSVKPRILILRPTNTGVQYVDDFNVININTDTPLCYFQLESETFNLGFDSSLIDDNYSDFKFFLDKFKRVEGYYLLDENDIADLDFFTPIYDDNYKHYFFISKIDKFIEGRPTKVELIRL